MRVRIRGTIYETVSDAAKALGVNETTVRTAIRRGREDTVGLGKGRGPRDRTAHGKPVRIGTFEWRSRKALAEYLGIPANTVNKALREGGPKAKANLLQRIMVKKLAGK